MQIGSFTNKGFFFADTTKVHYIYTIVQWWQEKEREDKGTANVLVNLKKSGPKIKTLLICTERETLVLTPMFQYQFLSVRADQHLRHFQTGF